MRRRTFLSLVGATAGVASSRRAEAFASYGAEGTERVDRGDVKMHVGTQRSPTTPKMLQFIKRHGVDSRLCCGRSTLPVSR